MKAAESGHLAVMQLLIKQRANLEACNKKRRTALSSASVPSNHRGTSADAVRMLLQAGADRNAADLEGFTPAAKAMKDDRNELAAVFNVKQE